VPARVTIPPLTINVDVLVLDAGIEVEGFGDIGVELNV
jgi:hypothetical protein